MQSQIFQPDSSYVNQAFYGSLVTFSQDLRRNPARLGDACAEPSAAHSTIEALLVQESLLLDERDFDQWLQLYAANCIYWIPGDEPAADPRQKITLEFHDRRRLQDRVARLGTGLAYSQVPASRTIRILDKPRIWASPAAAQTWHARSNFIMIEHRAGKSRTLAGWYGFAIGHQDDGYKILIKQINLLDCDAPQGNNSFFL